MADFNEHLERMQREGRISTQQAQQLREFKTMVDGNVEDLRKGLGADYKRLSGHIDDLYARLGAPGGGGTNAYRDGPPVDSEWISKAIWDSDEFKHFAKTGRGRVSIPIEGKTTITSATVGSSTPGVLTPERLDGIVKPAVRRIRIRELLPKFPTTHNAVDFIRENVYTNSASPQTEASDKAQSALTFTIGSATVHTVAHWIPATRQVLDDFVQLRAYMDTRLIDGLRDVEDLQLLSGDGLGDHFSGLVTNATAYNTSLNVSGDTLLDQLNHAILQLQLLEYQADGIVLNPRQWRAIQLLKDEAGGINKGEYVLGDPGGLDDKNPSIWGVPCSVTTAMATGKFLVASFAVAASLHTRMDAIVDLSDSHSDFFIKNLIAMRAEMREALAIKNTAALVYGTFV